MDFFNKKKLGDLEDKIKQLEYKLSEIQLTKDETAYLNLNQEIAKLENLIKIKTKELNELNQKIQNKGKELDFIEDELFFQQFGVYKPIYDFGTSEIFKLKLTEIRNKQKALIKDKKATNHSFDFTMDGNKSKGKEFINDTIKLSLRAFNNESDNLINKIKFNNIDMTLKKISTIFEQINKLIDMQRVSLKYEYLELKIKEAKLKYEYELKKEAEKQEQAAIKEQMKEEARVLKEIEAAKKKVEKEETHFINAISELNTKLIHSTDLEKEKLLKKLAELQSKLTEVTEIKNDIQNREKNTRAGYVYIISNIGSFGEDIYKIGMTRRLEPLDRIYELGNASVPFQFDVHAMIFSENAPTLENSLHKTFNKYSVNKINLRKEFFHVTLDMIEQEVKKNHNETVIFTKLAEAKEYRESFTLWQDVWSKVSPAKEVMS